MSVTAGPKLLIQHFRDRREIPSNGVLNRLVMDYARVDSQMESTLVELKAQFNDDPEAWLNLARQLIGFGNSGGGIILFGLDSKCERVGLAVSLTSKFDPANITRNCSGTLRGWWCRRGMWRWCNTGSDMACCSSGRLKV